MSTNDVPGAKKYNNDDLAMGCWAEHDDGSLIFVESTENGRAIYSVFDIADEDNPLEYRDSMLVKDFKQAYSWDPKKKDSIRWTWHDKTAFPWEKVIEIGAKDGVRYPSATQLISAAERVAQSRKLKGAVIDRDDHAHKVDRKAEKAAYSIMKGIQSAIESLRS